MGPLSRSSGSKMYDYEDNFFLATEHFSWAVAPTQRVNDVSSRYQLPTQTEFLTMFGSNMYQIWCISYYMVNKRCRRKEICILHHPNKAYGPNLNIRVVCWIFCNYVVRSECSLSLSLSTIILLVCPKVSSTQSVRAWTSPDPVKGLFWTW